MNNELTEAELRARFPNAPDSFIRANARPDPSPAHVQLGRAGQVAELERDPGHGTVGAIPIQKAVGQRVFVRVTAFRHNLLDEDNLCEKYHVDLCRYAGALLEDSAGQAAIEVTQQEIGRKEPEFVRIEIFYPEAEKQVCPEAVPGSNA